MVETPELVILLSSLGGTKKKGYAREKKLNLRLTTRADDSRATPVISMRYPMVEITLGSRS
jgi:hypothetical protein